MVGVTAEVERACAGLDARTGAYELKTDGEPLPVPVPPVFLNALFGQYVEMGRKVAAKLKSYGLHASQMSITSLVQLLNTPLFNFMCYDPKSKKHPRDGMTLYSNTSVIKVQGQFSRSW